ncbi:uncharacterized protein LOC108916036 [Anoplophora glabripennis]|uniref:uncharacterized protein LOC108916036 n=1 Tax=Anoplophora glabripennis TaxID=217634 RepID=UPI0008745C27|nr:uncharacterized protein LOC108916036 [Anoplophora glabripennis]
MTDFIEVYKSLPCLWQIKSKEYSDRNKKNAAYQKLIEKLKEAKADANRDFVIKKINSLRSSYRKEKKKVSESLKSGAGTEDVYTPTLWYYDLFKFLDHQETPRRPVTNFEDSQDENDIESVQNSPSQDRPPS